METEESEAFFEKMAENNLMRNTIEILDEEKQNILTETLRCDVCLELPVEKQVKICEQGHHFCCTCHLSMKVCAVCRGRLLESRNFVVERLVAKLAPILGIPKGKLPPAKPPCPLSKGSFKCLHKCSAQVPAGLMLSHLRDCHSTNLIDNVRSNPFFGRFSFTYNIKFIRNGKFIWSMQVSDLGLFTVEISFFELDIFGCARMLVDEGYASQFRYQLCIKFPPSSSESSVEYRMSNLTVLSYSIDTEFVKLGKNCLKIKGQDLLEYTEIGSEMIVFFSVGKNTDVMESNKQLNPLFACTPEKDLFFISERKIRRNKNRNMRRKKLKKRLGIQGV